MYSTASTMGLTTRFRARPIQCHARQSGASNPGATVPTAASSAPAAITRRPPFSNCFDAVSG